MSRKIVHHTVALCALVVTAGCGGDAPVATLDRASFIDTYVELRIAALQRGLGTVGDALRDTILTSQGVTEAQLVEFAEVHGTDLEYMRDVWAEVTDRLDAVSFEPVSPEPSPTGG